MNTPEIHEEKPDIQRHVIQKSTNTDHRIEQTKSRNP